MNVLDLPLITEEAISEETRVGAKKLEVYDMTFYVKRIQGSVELQPQVSTDGENWFDVGEVADATGVYVVPGRIMYFALDVKSLTAPEGEGDDPAEVEVSYVV